MLGLSKGHMNIASRQNITVDFRAAAPIGNNQSGIAPFSAQNTVNQIGVFRRIAAVQSVIRRHYAKRIALADCDFKAFQVYFAQGALADYGIGLIAVILLVVAGEMLYTRRNSLRLYSTDNCGSHFSGNERVLGEIFKISSAKEIPMDIHSGSKPDAELIFSRFLRSCLRGSLRNFGIPG